MDGSEKIKNLVCFILVFIFFQACNSPKNASIHLYENEDDDLNISNIADNIDTDLMYKNIDPDRYQEVEKHHDITSNYSTDSIEKFQDALENKYVDSLLYQYNVEQISTKSLNLDSNFSSQAIIKPERDTIYIEKEIIKEKTDTLFVEKQVIVEKKDTIYTPKSNQATTQKNEWIFIPPLPVKNDESTDSTTEKSTFIHDIDNTSEEEVFIPSETLFIPVILPFERDSSEGKSTNEIDYINTQDSASIFQFYAQYGIYLNKLLKDETIYTDEEKAIIQNLKEQVTIYEAKDSTINLNFDFTSFKSLPINSKIDSLNILKASIISTSDTLENDAVIFERKNSVEKIQKKKVEDIIQEKISKRENTEKTIVNKWAEVFPFVKTSEDSTLIVVKYSPNKTLPDSFEALAAAIEEMLAYYDSKNATVLLSSHTDAQGSAAYNLQLSEARAKNLKAALVKKGIAEHQIFYQYFGEKYATSPPDPTERRVEVLILR